MLQKISSQNSEFLSEYDQKKISSFFKNSTCEKVLLLGAISKGYNLLRVLTRFSYSKTSNHLQSKGRILFSMIPIVEAMQYCDNHNMLLLIIHNHCYGSVPSTSDIVSFDAIRKYASIHTLQCPLFAIFDMSSITTVFV